MTKVIVITSGKGGVGKTTSSANLSAALANSGYKTVVIDFDIGLRNLDLLLGCERKIAFDFIDVINNEASLNQALIKDDNIDNLYILAASQTSDKEDLTKEGVISVIDELRHKNFDYIICDSPAGIEKGALMALYCADEAIIVTNPEVSSIRDSSRIIDILHSKSLRSESKLDPIKEHLLITRYDYKKAKNKDMLSIEDVKQILNLPLVGIIPESDEVLKSSNKGELLVNDINSNIAKSYIDVALRLSGKNAALRIESNDNSNKKKGFFNKLIGRR